MKKDTQSRPGVSSSNKNKTAPVPIGEPQHARTQQPSGGMEAAPPSITISARYIDSRLKQFCWR